jgi:hypothetical protein
MGVRMELSLIPIVLTVMIPGLLNREFWTTFSWLNQKSIGESTGEQSLSAGEDICSELCTTLVLLKGAGCVRCGVFNVSSPNRIDHVLTYHKILIGTFLVVSTKSVDAICIVYNHQAYAEM